MSKAKPIPDGFSTCTPALIISGATKALEWYEKAFGAEVIMRMAGPNGTIMHAEFKIGNSILMLSDEFRPMGAVSPSTLGATPVRLHLYVENCDAVFNRAVGAGAQVTMPLMDMFWGDRYGMVTDPFGHVWGIATHKEDLTPEECQKRGDEAMKQMMSGGHGDGCCGHDHDA